MLILSKADWVKGVAHWREGETALISVAFTWRLPEARKIAEYYRAIGCTRIRIGGPGTFTQRKYLADFGAEIGGSVPDAIARHNPDATRSSYGCPVGCWFCIVPKMDGKTFTLLDNFPVRPILCDDNLSALPADWQRHVVARYIAAGVPLLDANSGFEPATFDDEVFARWKPILKGPWRFGYDETTEGANVERVFKMLKDVSARRKQVYTMIGHEPFDVCMDRIQRVIAWGGEPYAQPFIKLNALRKEPRIQHDWTALRLKQVQRWVNRRLWRKTKFEDYDASIKTNRPPRAHSNGHSSIHSSLSNPGRGETNVNIPSFLLNRNVRGVAQAATAGLLASVPAHISIAGNKFTLVDAAGNEKGAGYLHEGNLSLDIVIVYANPNVSKIFYDRPYDPNDSGPPDCFSDNGEGPSVNAGLPQSKVCSVCPKNSWGSATSNMTGKQTKACQDSKKLGVIVPAMGEMVFMLKVPPNSLKGLNAYVRKIIEWDLGPRKADPSDIMTRISFESQGTLRFDEVDFISEQAAGWVAALDSPEAEAKLDRIVGKTDRPRQEALPAPSTNAAQQGITHNPQAQEAIAAQMLNHGSPNVDFTKAALQQAQPTQEAPVRRRGRPEGATNKPKVTQAAPAATNGPGSLTDKQEAAQVPLEDADIPAFLRKNTPPVNNADPNPDMPFNTGTKSSFGIVPNPAVPDAALKSALDAAFALPTR